MINCIIKPKLKNFLKQQLEHNQQLQQKLLLLINLFIELLLTQLFIMYKQLKHYLLELLFLLNSHKIMMSVLHIPVDLCLLFLRMEMYIDTLLTNYQVLL